MRAEIICIIDRSGSMEDIRKDAIGGFNAFLKAQQELPGEARLSLWLFNDHTEVVVENMPIKDVVGLTWGTYVPSGTTSLFDAVGYAIDAVGRRLDSSQEKPDKVIVVILTDGAENSSRTYSGNEVAGMIKHQQEKYSWEFVFLAANQDAFTTGAALNIKASSTANFVANAAGVHDAYKYAARTVADMRSS